ncbi:MAG: NAD(P)-dependent glycerol-3-phosphate dehydrogenase [Acidobacteria bacterium]|nr:NAD(P)-dependent glycerol-3-phosphate dehydrogenase [Acidobacteriota bacterium]
MLSTPRKIALVGTGAWGTALAVHGVNAGLSVSLLGRRPELVARLLETHEHPALAGAPPLPGALDITLDAERAFAGADAVLWAVSVQATGKEMERLRPFLPAGVPQVATSKGIEVGSRRRITQVMAEVQGSTSGLAILSGPTFALEVARALPAAAVVASYEPSVSLFLQELLSSPTLRIYRSEDVAGVEIAGAAKNVIAIAAGLVDGLELGQNTRAALLTRALAEIRRLGTKLGGSPETFSGLAGTGDLILTATGNLSRNRRVGLALAKGATLAEALASLGGEVAEGVATTPAILEVAREAGVEMPIAEMVGRILSGSVAPREAVRALMTRGLKEEKG